MGIKSHEDLIVWQKGMDLVVLVYRIVKKLPKEELYSLSDQMRRAAVSIPSNIAEGQARNSKKEFVHFLSIAQGSRAEIQTQLLLCVRLGYLAEVEVKDALSLTQEVGRILTALIRRLLGSGYK